MSVFLLPRRHFRMKFCEYNEDLFGVRAIPYLAILKYLADFIPFWMHPFHCALVAFISVISHSKMSCS